MALTMMPSWLVGVVLLAFALQHSLGGASVRNGDTQSELKRELDDILQELTVFEKYRRGSTDDRYADEREAAAWLAEVDIRAAELYNEQATASWNFNTNITDENAAEADRVNVQATLWNAQTRDDAVKFYKNVDQFQNETVKRMLKYYAIMYQTPPAADPVSAEQITSLISEMTTIYGTAHIERDGKVYRLNPELTELLRTSRDYDELLWAWVTWRNLTGPPIKDKFTQLVSALNQAATDNGISDIGVAWRTANYEIDNIEPMVDAIFEQLQPLYEQLHAYVRSKLVDFYSANDLEADGPIQAHLLGDMWAQQWGNIEDIVTPYPEIPLFDITPALLQQGYTPERMFQTSEEFFTSIGLEPMTSDFWGLSMITRPEDREVQCHGAAYDFLTDTDFRIKMCSKVTMEDFHIIHHEMGHVEYYMQYRNQPTVFRIGANTAFHEAVGDTIALSVATPEHLRSIGLLDDDVTSDENDDISYKRSINYLMKVALHKVAFLPFAYILDKWRWEVFRGEITPAEYNTKWWQYRREYQGLTSPVDRNDAADFDLGSKFHVPANMPYIRYFLSFVGQFQFHQALCDAKNHQGPLHTCDIYRSQEAGALLRSALKLGASKPWPEVMQVLTGQRDFNATAILNYFKPLHDWLVVENRRRPLGWSVCDT